MATYEGTDGNDTYTGTVDADTINGNGGNDNLNGAQGDDIINGGAGDDQLRGELGTDTLNGGDGNDVLQGGGGGASEADVLVGGIGNDVYYVDHVGDQVIELAGEGTDTVHASLSWTLGDNVENLVMTNYGTGTGNALDNVLTASDYQGNTLQGMDGIDTLIGSNTNDVLDGGAGADIMHGGLGDDIYVYDGTDTIVDSGGFDTVRVAFDYTLPGNNGIEGIELTGTANLNATGSSGDDSLTGNSGDNILNGGGGTDYLAGGAGNDTYYVDDNIDLWALNSESQHFGNLIEKYTDADWIYEAAGQGVDTVYSSGGVALSDGSEVEFIILTGSAGDVWGSDTANDITGNDGNNVLLGRGGNDTIHGGGGNDGLDGGDGSDTLYGDNGDDELTGGESNDVLYGGDGSDVIDGGTGNDMMSGGTGDDFYYVDSTGDRVYENPGEGFDTVRTTVSFDASGTDIEKITLIADGHLNITGNALDNVITGNASINILTGGAGNDTYYVQNTGDQVIELAGEGTDTVFSTVTFTASDNVENVRLYGTLVANATGNALDNILEGNSAANILDGKAGADTMVGHAGNDTYYVNNAGDKVVEAANEGTDIVISSVTFSLAGNYVENLTLTGSASINGTGNSLDNVLTGNAGINTLIGGAGNDTYYVQNSGDVVIEGNVSGTDIVYAAASFSIAGQYVENLTLTGTGNFDAIGNGLDNILIGNSGNNLLNGGAGVDTMTGGLGNDTYVIDNPGDVIVEGANAGNDTVVTSMSFTVRATNLENVTLTGTDNLNATGNDSDNILAGNFGANTLTGGLGNDTYYVQNVNDVVVEKAGQGTDTVISSVGFSIAGQYIENLTLTGAINGNAAGNSLNNVLIGNDGNNLIRGFDGDDVLHGGLGADRLVGGNGADAFYFETALGAGNIDRIDDFNAFDDTIYLDRTIFTAFHDDGTVPIAGFGYATDPGDARIIYDKATGALSYDADGSGSGAAVQFATLATGLTLTYQDFVVFN